MSGAIWLMDYGELFNTVPPICHAQRIHLDVGDTADHHMILALYLRAKGDPFKVRVGYHPALNQGPVWTEYQTFNPSTDYRLHFRVSGRQHAVEFYWDTEGTSRIDGVEFDYQPIGRR